jgi:hypothetical protein
VHGESKERKNARETREDEEHNVVRDEPLVTESEFKKG